MYPLWVPMASINIAIKEEAYRFLKTLKSKNKSFSDVILEFKEQKRGILRFFGALQDIDWKQREKSMKDIRKSFEERL